MLQIVPGTMTNCNTLQPIVCEKSLNLWHQRGFCRKMEKQRKEVLRCFKRSKLQEAQAVKPDSTRLTKASTASFSSVPSAMIRIWCCPRIPRLRTPQQTFGVHPAFVPLHPDGGLEFVGTLNEEGGGAGVETHLIFDDYISYIHDDLRSLLLVAFCWIRGCIRRRAAKKCSFCA